MLTVRLFARFREKIGLEEEQLPLPEGVHSVAALQAHLAARGGDWELLAEGNQVLVAVNQEMAGPEHSIQAGDEVAFFPPVSGG